MMAALDFIIEKASGDGSYIRGFAAVHSVDGVVKPDWQGHEYASIEVLREALHEFIGKTRHAKVMHDGEQIGEVVEGIIIDDALAKALGVTDKRRGMFIGMKIHDEAVKKRVQSRELKAFSVGGRGRLVPIVEAA